MKVRLILRNGVADSEGKLAEYRYMTYVIDLPSEIAMDRPDVIGAEYLKE